ncbi:hypothetical protein ACA910_021674 [Epithemia clementina (nom. ined.)]
MTSSSLVHQADVDKFPTSIPVGEAHCNLQDEDSGECLECNIEQDRRHDKRIKDERGTFHRQEKAKAVIAALADMLSVEPLAGTKQQDKPIKPSLKRASGSTNSPVSATTGTENPFLCSMLFSPPQTTSPLRRSSLKRSGSDSSFPKRAVSFGSLCTRVYNIALSDHPSCSHGPPIALGWKYIDKEPIPLEKYERRRVPRRSLEELALPYNVRMYLLIHRAGYSRKQLDKAMIEVERVKRDRLMTELFSPIMGFFDEAVETLFDRMKGFRIEIA